MKKIKVLSVFGTRPEASKMAPVVLKLREYGQIDSKFCITAQHRSMIDSMLQAFKIEPDYDLNIMQAGQTITDITVNALRGLEKVYAEERPDLVLVHGDTTTTFAAALAAFYAKIGVGHVEAGLRTYDKLQPYPEEINRRAVAALADINFSPTQKAKENLLKENIDPNSIYVTGNTAIDATKLTVTDGGYVFEEPAMNKVDFSKFRVIVMTAHRRENLGEPFEKIFSAVRRLIDDNDDLFLVYPVHLNPLVQEPARRILGGHPRVLLTDPVGIKDLYNLIARSYLVLTDSGGLQEEASAFRKPVVVLRNVTERPEGLTAGTLRIGGTDEQSVYGVTDEILRDKAVYNAMAAAVNPFGDGNAAERIAEAILYHYGLEKRPEEFR